MVGWGETRGALSNAVSANLDGGVKYLETAKSCNTLYGAEKQDPPAYAAYLGPFDSLAEPCSLRMSVDHKSDVVTSLKPGVKIHVQCLCVLDPATFPTLAVGMESDTRAGIYIRSLQRLLVDIDQNPTHHITGEYDAETRDLIVPLQELNAIDVDPPGHRREADLADAARPRLRRTLLSTTSRGRCSTSSVLARSRSSSWRIRVARVAASTASATSRSSGTSGRRSSRSWRRASRSSRDRPRSASSTNGSASTSQATW